VLQSLGIPGEMLGDGQRYVIIVPPELAEKAKYELWQYEAENRPPRAVEPPLTVHYQDGIWGVTGYIVVISIVAVLAGESVFGFDWLGAGRVDGVLIRQGEWWRAITALTLHSGLPHFVGNVGFGALFGLMAGRVLGPGVTWLIVVLSAALANIFNTLLLDPGHRAIGASTAVFAALGLVAGFAWRAKLFAQDRWAYRLGPIVGGIALLAFTGTGSPESNTDTGAHLAGFVCGFVAGALMILGYRFVPDPRVQKIAGSLAFAVVAGAWFAALIRWA
jgi:membrane associated rhomboid family serine protease